MNKGAMSDLIEISKLYNSGEYLNESEMRIQTLNGRDTARGNEARNASRGNIVAKNAN